MILFGKPPKIKTVDKATAGYVLAFSYFNLILGATLFAGLSKTREFFIINDVLTYQVWGVAFFLVGAAQLTFYLLNRWTATRALFLVGFSLKLFWIIALLFRQVDHLDSNLILLVMFTALAAVQIVTFVHFPKKPRDQLWTKAD